MVGTLALAAVLGYFIGAVPTAFLLLRWKSKIDIRHAGSGNVGALNSFEVSESWWVGLVVLIVDLAKGTLAVLAARYVAGDDLTVEAVAGLAAVTGHNFPLWLKFRGGRGLATAVGVAIVILWQLIPLWMLFWCMGYALTRRVNPASALSTSALLIIAVFVPSGVFEFSRNGADPFGLRIFVVVLLALLLVKLVEPFREYMREK